jgi:hypothetical protein
MEALYDRQAQILGEKLQTLRPLVETLENNVENLAATENSEAETARKRKLEFENSVIDKKFRDQDDEDD